MLAVTADVKQNNTKTIVVINVDNTGAPLHYCNSVAVRLYNIYQQKKHVCIYLTHSHSCGLVVTIHLSHTPLKQWGSDDRTYRVVFGLFTDCIFIATLN